MGAALTQKQEIFCLAIVSGMKPFDAYKKAYNAEKMGAASISVQASKLLADPKITLRLEAIRKPVAEKVQYGLEQAMQEAQVAFEVSKVKEQGGAMVAAVQLRSKLNGLLVERKAITISIVQQMDDASLDAFIAAKAKESGVRLH